MYGCSKSGLFLLHHTIGSLIQTPLSLSIWQYGLIHVHEVPEASKKEKVITRLIERSARKVMILEMIPSWGFRGDFMRARLRHDV
jgi:hypothetical protein